MVIINEGMKLQKHFSSKVKDKTYYKYVIVLKEKDVKTAGFKEGDELEAETKKGEIKLRQKRH